MKKLLILILLVVVVVVATPPQETQAMMPGPCSIAAEYNWGHPGWNILCLWRLQMMDPPGDDGWVMNQTNDGATIESAQQPLRTQMQAVEKKQFVIWQPLRA